IFFFFSSRRRHTRSYGDWSSDVCSSDLCSQRLQRRGNQDQSIDRRQSQTEMDSHHWWVYLHPSGGRQWHRLLGLLGWIRACYQRSEERRVGKECRARRVTDQEEKKIRRK